METSEQASSQVQYTGVGRTTLYLAIVVTAVVVGITTIIIILLLTPTASPDTATSQDTQQVTQDDPGDKEEAETDVKYLNKDLGIEMMIPGNWNVREFLREPSGINLGEARVTFVNKDNKDAFDVVNFVGDFGFCDKYAGDLNATGTAEIKRETLTISGTESDLNKCFYDGIFDSAVLIVRNKTINDWDGIFFSTLKQFTETEFAQIRQIWEDTVF